MNSPPAPTSSAIEQRVSADEWQTRVDLAACYRQVADLGANTFLMLRNHGLLRKLDRIDPSYRT